MVTPHPFFLGMDVLHEKKAWVKDVFVKEVNMHRITFTAPLINKARHITFSVTGKAKSQMLEPCSQLLSHLNNILHN